MTSQFDCRSRFQICDLHGSSFFSAIYTKHLQFKIYWFCEIFAEEILEARIILELGYSLVQLDWGYHFTDFTYWLINFDASCHFPPSTFGVVRVTLTLFTNKTVSLPVSSFLSFDSCIGINWCQQTVFLLSLIYSISFLPIILPINQFHLKIYLKLFSIRVKELFEPIVL